MKKSENHLQDKRALEIITEQPNSFVIKDKCGKDVTLFLYPLQLGRLAMISQRLIDLDLSLSEEDEDEVRKMWKICSEKPVKVAEIIAIASLQTKEDIEKHLTERTEQILWSPSMDTLAYTNLLSTIVFQSYYGDFMTAIRSVKTLRVMISQMTTADRVASTEGVVSGDK